MDVSFIRNRYIALVSILVLLTASCAQKPTSAALGDSHYGPCKIFQVVLRDFEVSHDRGEYLASVKSIPLVWDDAPNALENCGGQDSRFKLSRSSSLDVKPGDKYIIASKMYFDDEAAFVELSFLPTGKQGDFFLRNRGKWTVVQQRIWETKLRR